MKVTDTSSAQARRGKDIQGIPWDRLNITRESYRLTRLEQYRNYENIPLSGDAVDKVHYLKIPFPIYSLVNHLNLVALCRNVNKRKRVPTITSFSTIPDW